MELPDDALTRSKTKSWGLMAGRWWRWTRYELRDGCICPAPKAQLRVYDPWKLWLKTRPIGRRSYQEDQSRTPYRALLEMLRKLEYRRDSAEPPELSPAEFDLPGATLTSESERAILAWCTAYGLLGVLPHRVLQAVFAPQAGVQLQYVRIGIGSSVVPRNDGNPMTPMLQPSAAVQPLHGVGITVEPLSATWARFFPSIAPDDLETFAYPQPLTDTFWKMYCEPLGDFLSGARALLGVLAAIRLQELPRRHGVAAALRRLRTGITGGLPTVVNALVAPTGLAAAPGKRGRLGLNLVSNSLLASLTTMLLDDLSQGRALQCPCGQLFVSNAYQARHCSRRCRWRFEQREFREGKKEKNERLQLAARRPHSYKSC